MKVPDEQLEVGRNLVVSAIAAKSFVVPTSHKKSRVWRHYATSKVLDCPCLGRAVTGDFPQVVIRDKCNVADRGVNGCRVKLFCNRRDDIGGGIKIVRVEDADDFSGRHLNPFIHCVIEPVIGLRNTPCYVRIASDNFAGVISGRTVNDDVLDGGVALASNALQARAYRGSAVAADGDD